MMVMIISYDDDDDDVTKRVMMIMMMMMMMMMKVTRKRVISIAIRPGTTSGGMRKPTCNTIRPFLLTSLKTSHHDSPANLDFV